MGPGDFNVPALVHNAAKPTTLTIAGIAELAKQRPVDEERPRIKRKESTYLTE